jgi:hypothetical protein
MEAKRERIKEADAAVDACASTPHFQRAAL